MSVGDYDVKIKEDGNLMFIYNKIETKKLPNIKDVIFNPPATIVCWGDNTKTVVKTQNGEFYDPEKGLAMAITKKALGNQGNYFETIKKWTMKYVVPKAPEIPELKIGKISLEIDGAKMHEMVEKAADGIITAVKSRRRKGNSGE